MTALDFMLARAQGFQLRCHKYKIEEDHFQIIVRIAERPTRRKYKTVSYMENSYIIL